MLEVLFVNAALGLIGVACASRFSIDAHVTHGVNTFNDKPLVDFTASSNLFSSVGSIYEIGVQNPGKKNASAITEDTPLNTLMATLDAYDFQQQLNFPRGIGPFNIPISETPTLSGASQNINDRVSPKSFADSKDPSVLNGPYLSEAADNDVTLKEWNSVSGRFSGICRGGKAFVKVQIKNGLPNGVYTMWDVGVMDALTSKEALAFGPFAGLPNVISTDSSGNGYAVRRLNYCPVAKCPGSKRCTLYVSLFYHFDHMVYAGIPAFDAVGQTVGQIASNHVQFFTNGEVIVPPQNKFRSY